MRGTTTTAPGPVRPRPSTRCLARNSHTGWTRNLGPDTSSGFQIHAGGATGIDLSSDVTQVLAHTHPYHLPALGPSADDVAMLSQLGQSSLILLEHGQIILFGPGGTIAWR